MREFGIRHYRKGNGNIILSWVESSDNVYIDHKNATYNLERSKWANPFTIGASDYTLEDSMKYYETHIRSNAELFNNLNEIEGKQLGCFCLPSQCHGNVSIKFYLNKSE